jgi:nucleotide-binding universal stress UspA family protein
MALAARAGMKTIRRILAAVDLSSGSDAALEGAETLARAFGARLDVLHVWEPPDGIVPPGMVLADGFDDRPARAEMQTRVEAIAGRGVDAHALFATGGAVEEILRAADHEQADLLVMSTHGRTGLKRILLGSVAESVMRRASCPVVLVRE